jgi:hypothetical protein
MAMSARNQMMIPVSRDVEYMTNDYSDYIVKSGLEQSVVDSHNKFTSEIQNKTTGASAETVFSHDDDIVPWVGLRRPDYRSVTIDPNAREVPSTDVGKLSSSHRYSPGGLF